MKNLLLALALMVFGGIGCRGNEATTNLERKLTIDRATILLEARENNLIMDEQEIAMMAEAVLEQDPNGRSPEDVTDYLQTNVKSWRSAALADVTGGDGYGIAHASFQSDTFTLLAEMGNLPDPALAYHYEAWLVRREKELAVLSLGSAKKIEDGYFVVYLSDTDLSDHDFFVLTLEPDDGNTAPAEHILEGMLK
jgi:hypothetical protein